MSEINKIPEEFYADLCKESCNINTRIEVISKKYKINPYRIALSLSSSILIPYLNNEENESIKTAMYVEYLSEATRFGEFMGIIEEDNEEEDDND